MAAMFLKKNQTPRERANPAYRERSLFPILSAEQLLAGMEQNRLLEQVNRLVGDDMYQRFYLPLIQQFAQYVQVIPVNAGGRLGGLLNEGLRRAILATQAAFDQAKQPPDQPFIFAVFSAVLLFDIAKIVTQQQINISNKSGELLKIWNPYEGPMQQFGAYYKMRHYGSAVRLSPYITLMLARQIVPQNGFILLAQNSRLLNLWLAALCEDEGGAGGFTNLLTLSKQMLEQMRTRNELLSVVDVELSEPLETEAGEDFHDWLKEGLADGSLSVNQEDSLVHMVAEGVFIDAAIFEQFSRTTAKYRLEFDVTAIHRQYGLLGFTATTAEDLKFVQYNLAGTTSKASSSSVERLGQGLLSSSSKRQSVKKTLIAEANNTKTGIVVNENLLFKDKKVPSVNAKLVPVAPLMQNIPRSLFDSPKPPAPTMKR